MGREDALPSEWVKCVVEDDEEGELPPEEEEGGIAAEEEEVAGSVSNNKGCLSTSGGGGVCPSLSSVGGGGGGGGGGVCLSSLMSSFEFPSGEDLYKEALSRAYEGLESYALSCGVDREEFLKHLFTYFVLGRKATEDLRRLLSASESATRPPVILRQPRRPAANVRTNKKRRFPNVPTTYVATTAAPPPNNQDDDDSLSDITSSSSDK